jgi:hypothetical protein
MENFVCKPCPPSRILLILGVAIVALILFAVFSSSVDFPPLVSVAQSMKLLMSTMQGFVSIRLLTVSWPPVVLQMFDFARYFTFNFNSIRPECSVDYTPQTKLLFTLLGPTLCTCFIIMLAIVYSIFKCWRITKLLQTDSIKSIHNKGIKETALSVARCLLTTSFCLKFGSSRMMVEGALWNALSPALVTRTNTTVLQQKVRRRTVLQGDDAGDVESSSSRAFVIPEDWTKLQVAVSGVHAQAHFARSTKRLRLLVASALSIFIFTFQGSMESAVSTFDCSSVDGVQFLRSNPTVQCSLDDGMYFSMVITTIIGIIVYCVLLPAVTVVALKSRWCRGVRLHDNLAYIHIFGFLTSMYTKACVLWELVACLRKVAFVAIPILISSNTLLQSIAMFTCHIVNAFITLRMQPMVHAVMNHIETISSMSLILSSFASIFFTIEYRGTPVLSGAARDLAGLVLVIICAICLLLCLRLIWNDFSSRQRNYIMQMIVELHFFVWIF